MEATLQRVVDEFGANVGIKMIELGVANGGTTIGIYNWCVKFYVLFRWQGFDMAIGKPSFEPDGWGEFIEGNFHSLGVYAKGRECNLLFIDGCHCYECVMKDFAIFSSKVCKRGFILFHDTNSHPDWQNHHEQCQPGRMIETRRALRDLQLYPVTLRDDYKFIGEQNEGKTQGMMLFQKI